jgi:hypothetical protein
MIGKWVTIQQYSVANNISVSTIRRHIKSKKLKSKLDDGKYLIFDPSADANAKNAQPTFSCPALKELSTKDAQIEELTQENENLKEQIVEFKMLLKILEDKSGIKVTV